MQVYLPIAEMAVQAETILMVSGLVGFLSGVFGIGGGFLTTPFLIFIGIPPAIAVGTQTSQMVASSTAGVLGHFKKAHVDVKVGLFMLSGGLVGSVVGTGIFALLKSLGQIDFVISFFYIILLGVIGVLMLSESVKSLFFKPKGMRKTFHSQKTAPMTGNLPFKTRFPRSNLYVSVLVPLGLGFVGGILVSVLGIGGGFLLVPAMIYILGMPTALVVGTSLFQMVFTTAFSTMMHAGINQTVDVTLAVVLIVGGVIGAQIGVSFARFIKGVTARLVLALIVLAVCLQLIGQMFLEPDELYSTFVLAGAG